MPTVPTPAPVAPARLDTLQILRAVAAGTVVAGHILQELDIHFVPALHGLDMAFPGGFGVDLFFVVSGFVMVHTTRDANGTTAAARGFILRRLVRIVPLYWLATTLMIAAVFLVPAVLDTARLDIAHFVASYLFLPYARPTDEAIRPILALGWTLQYEMYFYAVFALGLLLPRRYGPIWVLAILALPLISGQVTTPTTAVGGFVADPIVLEFAMGMGIGLVYAHGHRVDPRLAVGGAAALTLGMLVVVGPIPPTNALRFLHSGLPAAAIVAAAALSRGFDTVKLPGWLVGMGDASYATYLSHPFVIAFSALTLGGLLGTFHPLVFATLFALVVLPGTYIAGHVIHRRVDMPLIGALRRRISGGTAPSAAPDRIVPGH